MPLETVTAAAGWPAECTFATYYKKDVKEHTTFVYTWLLSLMILVTLISYHCQFVIKTLRLFLDSNKPVWLQNAAQFVLVLIHGPCCLKSHGSSNMQMRRQNSNQLHLTGNSGLIFLITIPFIKFWTFPYFLDCIISLIVRRIIRRIIRRNTVVCPSSSHTDDLSAAIRI